MSEVRLVLLGERETGKSSAGNSILGRAGFFQAGVVTEECVRQQAEVAKWLVTVVDTPGWEAGITGGTTERVKREIATSVGLCPPGPHALLLTLRVDTLVVSGHVRDHLELLSEGVWRHTLLLFTHGDQLREGVSIQQHVQGGGRDLRWLLEKCRGRYHVISSLDGGERDKVGVTDLLLKVEKMAVMNRCEAFSGLVHEIRVLSLQKNEKFNQRMKEMRDKMLRQEAELKKMREREVKSIRRFFELRKKVKLHKKTVVQREEEEDEDSRSGRGKIDYGELEERIQWLAEVKEREIQDLSLEKERIDVALKQSMKERDNATVRLDLKQRELEELNERIEELQLKVLHLQRANVEKENERKHREESIEVMKQEWICEVQKLVEDIELQKKEKGEWTEKVRSLQTEMEESKMQRENVLRRKTHETNTAMAEMEQRLKGEMEAKLFEKEQQQKELRRKMQAILDNAKLCERQMEIKVEEMKCQHDKEVERKTQDKEAEVQMLKLQHREEMDRKTSEIRKIQEELKAHQKELAQMEAIKKQHKREKIELQQEKESKVAEIKRVFANKAERQVQAKMRDLEDRYLAQIEKKVSESNNENERIQMNFRKEMTKIQEKEREIELLNRQHQEEMERRLKETERKEEQIKEMEKALEQLKKEYEDEIKGVEKNSESEIKELRQQFEQEIEKLFQERQRMEKYALELEERVSEGEKAKEVMIESHKKSILLHLKERDTHVDELKHAHVNEIQDKTQEFEKEKDRIVTILQEEAKKIRSAKETELKGLKLILDETKQKLRQTEDEKRDLEEKQAERSREMEVRNARLIDLEHQLKWTAEERETHERHMHEELKEKDKMIETLNQRITDMNEILRRKEEENDNHKEEVEQRLQGRERELEMMQQLLKERQRESESLRQQAECREVNWRDEQRRKEKEINTVEELIEQKTREITEAQQLLAEREREMKEAKTECASCLKAMKEMEERCENQNVALLRIQQSHAEQLRRKDAEMMEKVKESEGEMHRLRRENGAKEKELVMLRSRIEQTKAELKDISRKMEKEMTGIIQEYEKEIEKKNYIVASVAKEKDRIVENYDDSRRRIEELQEENEKIRKEAESLRLKLKTEVEVNRYFQECQQQVESGEVDQEKDAQIRRLKETQDGLQRELYIMTEKKGEAERKIQMIKEEFEVKLREKQCEFTTKELQIKEEILKREKEVAEREKVLGRNEEALRKRGYELGKKEEELVDKGVVSENKAHKLSGMQGLSEKVREERSKYRRDEKRRGGEELWEREQEELSMLLNGRENEEGQRCSVRDEEQQKQQEHVDATTGKLGGTAGDLTMLTEELHNKERSLSNGEKNLKEREGEMHKDEENQRVQEDSFDFANEDLHLEHREIQEEELVDKSAGSVSDREEKTKEKEDRRVIKAAGRNNHHAETVKAMIAGEKEGKEGTDAERKKTKNPSKAKVMRDSQFLSAGRGCRSLNKRSQGSDLRVMVLGESWSPHAPDGLTILCGEPSKQDGSTFRHWRGQVAGHRLSVVEPLGLKWRDGPGPYKAGQRKSILDSVSQCCPGPHVVVLLLPAFLTCTQRLRSAMEEHVSWLGADVWRRALVLFTWGEMLGESVEQHVLRNRELMELVGKCEGRYHMVTSNKNNSLLEGLLEKMEDIVATNRF